MRTFLGHGCEQLSGTGHISIGNKCKNTSSHHPDARLDLFTCQKTRIGMVVGYHYGSLIFADLVKKRHKTERYGEGVTPVVANMLRKWAIELPEELTDFDGIQHKP